MQLESLVGEIAGSRFANMVFEALTAPVHADHFSVMQFDADLKPSVVLAASRDGSETARLAGDAYVRRGLYLTDPVRLAL